MRVAEPARLLAGDERAGRDVDQARQSRIEERHLQPGTPAGAHPPDERAEDPDCRVRPREHVHDRHARLHRLAFGVTGDRHQAALGLDDEVIARPVRLLAVGAEPGDRAVDQSGILGSQLLVSEPEPRGRAGAEVLDDDVGA